MKKILFTLSKVFLVIILLSLSLYFVYKRSVKNNLEDKLKILNNNWVELIEIQNEKNDFLIKMINESPKEIEYLDSLKEYLIKQTKNKKVVRECDQDFVYEQYLSNKYMLPFIKFYSEKDMLVNIENKNKLNNLHSNLKTLNEVITKYNTSVRDYNFYITVFPNFLIARSYDYSKKDYFEIKFGIENIDPKIAKKQRREWQRKIELEHGLSE